MPKYYKAILSGDDGLIKIITPAENEAQAIRHICLAANYPESAIKIIREVPFIKFHL